MSVSSRPESLPHSSGSERVIQVAKDDQRWDDFVLRTPDATVFHHSGWLAALEDENRRQALRLACERPDGTLSGVLPLMVTRGLPLRIAGASAGPRLSSLPRTPAGGPLGTSEAVRNLAETAMNHARSAGLRLQFKQAARSLDGIVPGLQARPWRLSYVKPLPDDPALLRFGNSRNHARIMWAVRKAGREGLRVRDAADESELRCWYRLYLDVNRWRGLPSRSYRFFRSAWEQLRPGGFLRLLLAYRENSGGQHPVAGAMLLMLGGTVHYAFNGRQREALAARPNELLQWHAMHDAAAAGYRWYDFGEVAENNEDLARFKGKWGTEVRPLVRYHAPPLPGGESGYGRLSTTSLVHRTALAAWRRLPLPVTAFAGDQLYRFL